MRIVTPPPEPTNLSFFLQYLFKTTIQSEEYHSSSLSLTGEHTTQTGSWMRDQRHGWLTTSSQVTVH